MIKNLESLPLKLVNVKEFASCTQSYKESLIAKNANNKPQKDAISKTQQDLLNLSLKSFNKKINNLKSESNLQNLKDSIAACDLEIINVTQRELLNNFISFYAESKDSPLIKSKFIQFLLKNIGSKVVSSGVAQQNLEHLLNLLKEDNSFNNYLSILFSYLNNAIENKNTEQIKLIVNSFQHLNQPDRAFHKKYINFNSLYKMNSGNGMLRTTMLKIFDISSENIAYIIEKTNNNIEKFKGILESIQNSTKEDRNRKTLTSILLQPENIDVLLKTVIYNLEDQNRLKLAVHSLSFDRLDTKKLKEDLLKDNSIKILWDIIKNNDNSQENLKKFITENVSEEHLRMEILKDENFAILFNSLKNFHINSKNNKTKNKEINKGLKELMNEFIDDREGKIFIKNKDTIKAIDDIIDAINYDKGTTKLTIDLKKFNQASLSSLEKWGNLIQADLNEIKKYEEAKSKNESLASFLPKFSDPQYQEELKKSKIFQENLTLLFASDKSLFFELFHNIFFEGKIELIINEETLKSIKEIISNPLIREKLIESANQTETLSYYQDIMYDALQLLGPEKLKSLMSSLDLYLKQLQASFKDSKNQNKANSKIFMQGENLKALFEILEIISKSFTNETDLDKLSKDSFFRNPVIQNLMIITKELSKGSLNNDKELSKGSLNNDKDSFINNLIEFMNKGFITKGLSVVFNNNNPVNIILSNPIIFEALLNIENYIVDNTIKTIDSLLMSSEQRVAHNNLTNLNANITEPNKKEISPNQIVYDQILTPEFIQKLLNFTLKNLHNKNIFIQIIANLPNEKLRQALSKLADSFEFTDNQIKLNKENLNEFLNLLIDFAFTSKANDTPEAKENNANKSNLFQNILKLVQPNLLRNEIPENITQYIAALICNPLLKNGIIANLDAQKINPQGLKILETIMNNQELITTELFSKISEFFGTINEDLEKLSTENIVKNPQLIKTLLKPKNFAALNKIIKTLNILPLADKKKILNELKIIFKDSQIAGLILDLVPEFYVVFESEDYKDLFAKIGNLASSNVEKIDNEKITKLIKKPDFIDIDLIKVLASKENFEKIAEIILIINKFPNKISLIDKIKNNPLFKDNPLIMPILDLTKEFFEVSDSEQYKTILPEIVAKVLPQIGELTESFTSILNQKELNILTNKIEKEEIWPLFATDEEKKELDKKINKEKKTLTLKLINHLFSIENSEKILNIAIALNKLPAQINIIDKLKKYKFIKDDIADLLISIIPHVNELIPNLENNQNELAKIISKILGSELISKLILEPEEENKRKQLLKQQIKDLEEENKNNQTQNRKQQKHIADLNQSNHSNQLKIKKLKEVIKQNEIEKTKLEAQYNQKFNQLKKYFELMEDFYSQKAQKEINNYVKNYKSVADHSPRIKDYKKIYISSLAMASLAISSAIIVSALPKLNASVKIASVIPLLIMAIIASTLAAILIQKTQNLEKDLLENIANSKEITAVDKGTSTDPTNNTADNKTSTEINIATSTPVLQRKDSKDEGYKSDEENHSPINKSGRDLFR